MWFWASVPSLVAACVAVVVTLQGDGAGRGGASGHENIACGGDGRRDDSSVKDVPQVNQVEVTRTAAGDVILAGQQAGAGSAGTKDAADAVGLIRSTRHLYRVIEQPAEKVGFVEVKPF